MSKRIYVCKTYYQVYISLIKEILHLRSEGDKADIMLSNVSTDFKDLDERVRCTGIFSSVFKLNERHPSELVPDLYGKRGKGSFAIKIIRRIIYTHKMVHAILKDITFDFSEYQDIFLFDDPDPLGFYFWKKKIPYIAIEDALNIYQRDLLAGDRRAYYIKILLFHIGLIYIPQAHAKNARYVEVNDRRGIICVPQKKIVEVPRNSMISALKKEDNQLIVSVFEKGLDSCEMQICSEKSAIIITQCLYPVDVPTKEIQINLYKKLIKDYCQGYCVYIKPHPRDTVDYEKWFPECTILGKYYPIEVLNLYPDICFEKAITISSTAIDTINIVKEKLTLGDEYIDNFT